MNAWANGAKQGSSRTEQRVRVIALLFSVVCGLFSLGTALWLLSITQAPGITNSVENVIGVWLMIIVFGLLAFIYLPTALLLLLEVKRVCVVNNEVTLVFWFLGQIAIAQNRHVHEIGYSRVVRFGESDKKWGRVRIVFVAPILLCTVAPIALDDDVVLKDGHFFRI